MHLIREDMARNRRSSSLHPGVNIAQRVLVAVIGGYLLSASVAAWGALALAQLISRSEAVVLMAMLAFVIYLVVLIWAFAEPRLALVWWVLGLGGGSFAMQWLIGATG